MPLLDVPLVRQVESHDCGTAAAAMVLKFHRRKVPDLAAAGWPSPIDGTDPRVVEAILRNAGLGVVSGELHESMLAFHVRQGRPVACLIQHNGCGHWVVVVDVAYRRPVQLNCPAEGRRKVRLADFLASWVDVCRDGTRYHQWGVVAWK